MLGGLELLFVLVQSLESFLKVLFSFLAGFFNQVVERLLDGLCVVPPLVGIHLQVLEVPSFELEFVPEGVDLVGLGLDNVPEGVKVLLLFHNHSRRLLVVTPLRLAEFLRLFEFSRQVLNLSLKLVLGLLELQFEGLLGLLVLDFQLENLFSQVLGLVLDRVFILPERCFVFLQGFDLVTHVILNAAELALVVG